MKHNVKRTLSLLLALVMAVGFLPSTASAATYTELGTISVVRATQEAFTPTLGGKTQRPQFTITEPAGKGVGIPNSQMFWQKKTGNSWSHYMNSSFEEGTYRLKVQLRTDHFDDDTYYRLLNSTRFFVNGSEWTKVGDLEDTYSSRGYGVMYFAGPSYTVQMPSGYHTVTVENDGNGTASSDPTFGPSGTVVTLTAKPKAGYKLKYWEVVSGGVTVSNNQFAMGNQNVVIKAHFEQKVLTNLGAITEVRATTGMRPPVIDGTCEIPEFNITYPTDKGVSVNYHSSVWQKKSGTGWNYYYGSKFTEGTYRLIIYVRSTVFEDGTYYTLSDNTAFSVNGTAWEYAIGPHFDYLHEGYEDVGFASPEFTAASPVLYTVTLDPNGGSVSPTSMTTDADGKLSGLPTPTRAGYSFLGWYTKKSGGAKVSTDTVFSENSTVYAHWSNVDMICEVTVTPPMPGQNPVSTGESGDLNLFTVATVAYVPVNSDGSLGAALKETDVFTPNQVYRVVLVLWPVGGWEFSKDSRVIINGMEATCLLAITGNGLYYVDMKCENPFVDVHESDFFFNPVMWAVGSSVTGGTDKTHFSPERTVMRADSMVFFWAANGRPGFSSTDKTFKDVKETHWAYKAVMWAVENGITGGTNTAGTEFSPQRTCSRSEILQFLYAALGKPAYTIGNPYSDVKEKHWYYEGAIWAYEKGLEKGEGGRFNAATPCTRAYVVTYLYRYFTGSELAE